MTSRRLLPWLLALPLVAAGLGILWLLREPEPEAARGPGASAAADEAADEAPVLPPAGPGSARAAGAPPLAAPAVEALASRDAPTVLEARVVDRAGTPLAGALVTPFESRPAPPFRERHDLRPAEPADAEGRVEIVGLPAGVALGLEVEHPGFAPLTRETFSLQAGTPTALGDLVLEAGFAVEGTVTGEDGAPLPGTVVSLRDETTRLRGAAAPPVESVTDGAGDFAFEHLAPRHYELQAEAAGHAGQSMLLSLALGTAGSRFRQDFKLQRADHRVEGVVLGGDELPLGGARVQLTRRIPGSHALVARSAETAADGGFAFEALGEGRYELLATAAGHYLPERLAVFTDGRPVVVRMPPTLSVRGALACEGAPPARFTVVVRPQGRTGAALPAGQTAERRVEDGRGEFSVVGLRPGAYRFEVLAEGYAPSESADVVLGPESGEARVVVPLQLGGTIEGRVEPAAGAVVELRGADFDPGLVLEAVFPTEPVHGFLRRADAQGRFRFEHVPQGRYTLTARAPGAPPLHVRDVQAVEAGRTDVGTLALQAGATVEGRVLGADGRPAAGVRVQAASAGHQAQATSDAEGAFRLEQLPPGDYELVAMPGGFFEAMRFEGSAAVSLRPGETQEIVLALLERRR